MSKGPAKAKRGIPSKVENFNEWYPFIVEASDLVDKRYPIKGMDVWRPYGWKTMKLIDERQRSIFNDNTEKTKQLKWVREDLNIMIKFHLDIIID